MKGDAGMPVSYQSDIRRLFTQLDRDHMLKSFDLWSYDDVKKNAQAIYAVVESGKMPPPDEEPRWSRDSVQKLKQWIEGGYQP
jgi:hypothetical protein